MTNFAARIIAALTAGIAVQVNYANHSLNDTAHLRVATFNRDRVNGSILEPLIDGNVPAVNPFTTRMDYVVIPSVDGNVQFTGSMSEDVGTTSTIGINGRSTVELVGIVLGGPNASMEQHVTLLAIHALVEGAAQRPNRTVQNEIVG